MLNYTALKTRNLQSFPVPVEHVTGTEFTYEPARMEGIQTIRLVFAGPQEVTTVKVLLKDDSHKHVFVEANEVQISPGSTGFNDVTLRLAPHYHLYGFSVRWDNDAAMLQEVHLNHPVPYRFFFKRFLLLFAVCAAFLAAREFRLWRIVYDHKNKKHVLLLAATALVCMLFSVYLFRQLTPYDITKFPWAQRIAYPFEDPIETYEPLPHVLLFDAIYNGSPHIRVMPDPRYAEIENPYDYTQKEAAGLHYADWWDYVYYNGKFYVYFGVTPVLIFYFPYYFLTGVLPSYTECSLFLAFLAVAGGFLCFEALARRYAEKIPLPALMLTSAAVVTGSQVWMLQVCPNRYHMSIASEQAFFFLTLWAALRALESDAALLNNKKPVVRRRIWLVLSAVFTALMVASRPSATFILAGWLFVLFMTIVLEQGRNVREKVKDAAAYLVPVALLGTCIMAYNYIRFGSVTEFGIDYIMSVWDVVPNRMDFALTSIPKAIWHYGFEPMRLSSDFPWLRLQNSYVNHTGNYHYVNMDGNAGAFVVPVTWGSFLYLLSAAGRKAGTGAAGKRPKEWKILFFVSAALVIVTMWMNHTLGGTSERYVCDVMPALCLMGGVCFLGDNTGTVLLYSNTDQDNGRTVLLHARVLTAICVLTLVMAVCRGFSNEVNAIAQFAPARYLTFVRMFSLP
ncbi:MAG: hypothetical protein IJQ21_12980 [Lachnospiraceae bacterium]|nr:hypothetical protein [Lachnospiraceae bacterium]